MLELKFVMQMLQKEPFLWLLGSDVVVIDPPRKGLDASLIDALKNISSVERKAFSSSGSKLIPGREETLGFTC